MCDGSVIEKGKWKGERTPNLTSAFLLGAEAGNMKQKVKEPLTFNAELDQKISATQKNNTPGFCFHDRNLATGCVTGFRYENHVGLSTPHTEVSSYLRTYRVVYIIKCW